MKIRLRYIAACLAAAALLAGTGAQKSAADQQFRTARQEVDAITVGWNLGNTLDSYGTWINGTSTASYETAWGNPVTTREMLAAVRNRGFNAVRIPVTWAQHIDDAGNIDAAWLDRVNEVVDYAIDEGLIVILNVHHDTGEHGGDKVAWMVADNAAFDQVRNKYSNLWTQIANRFKDYDDRLMFEGYNEILDINNSWGHATAEGAYDATNSFAQAFVDAVRATGGNNAERNLIVCTYVASHEDGPLNRFVLPNDTAADHLIAEVHVYAPWGFTGTAEAVTWTTTHDDFRDEDRAEIDRVMFTLDQFSQSIGVPVIIGECGAEAKNNDSERAAYAGYLTQQAAEHGIRIFWWDNGASYSIFDRNSLSFNDAIADALTGNAAQTEPAETTETAEQTQTTEQTTEQTEQTVTPIETTDIAEQTEETQARPSSAATGFNPIYAVYIAVGVIIVAAVYKLIYELAKRNANK